MKCQAITDPIWTAPANRQAPVLHRPTILEKLAVMELWSNELADVFR